MKVKFSRCNSNSLTNVPQVDGQLIYVKDTSEVYMDVGNSRNKLSDVIEVADITNIQNPIISKIYYDEATENLYKYIDNEWKSLGGSSSPQVFYWDGNTQQAGLDFWNNIYQLQKTQPCLVYTRYTQNNVPIIQHWIYDNDMPTSIADTAVVYSVYTPSGMKMIDNSYTRITRYTYQLYFTITDDQVTAINRSTHTPADIDFIQITTGYSRAFTPSLPAHPATKKYVDDQVGSINTLLDSINGEVV